MRRQGNAVLVFLCLLAIVAIALPKLPMVWAGNGLLPIPQMQGQRDQGTTVQGFPFLMGVSDGTNVQNVSGDSSGNINVNVHGSAPANLVYINPTNSNGAAAVVLVSGVAAKQVLFQKIFIANTSSTVSHLVTLQSHTTTTRAIKLQIPVSASFAIDGDIALSWGTIAGEGLDVVIDAGGAAADVTVSGSTVQQ